MNLNGKNILITGASQGIGRYLATYFAAKTARVILSARREDRLRETAALVERAGGACLFQASDLCIPQTLERLARFAEEEAGGVDLLINNAADVRSKPLLDTSLEDIDALIRTNVIGCLQLCRLLLPGMKVRPEAMIVNISSLTGYKPNPAQTAYSVSKRAVNGISDALRAELKGTGVRVLNVALCSIDFDEPVAQGHVLVSHFAQRLETAVRRNETELFMTPAAKWLMRLYGLFPRLMFLK